METERGLLDLIITHIPRVNVQVKAALCLELKTESELEGISYTDIEDIAVKHLPGLETVNAKLPKKMQKELFKTQSVHLDLETLREKAEADAAFMKKLGISYISIAENAYPGRLKEIFDPPPVLFYRGKFPDLLKPAVAIVGTRKASSDALEYTFQTARCLARYGVSVISGLAAGIDAMAHRGCIEGFAATYAVFGSSPDEVYPASNRQLAQRILQHNGALISEYPPQTHPSKWTFPARNRIISGLSSLVLVVQAGKKSGALITADFALDQGRELAVAASPCGHVFGEGCEKLAADGAPLIKSAEDILSALNISPQIAPRENPPASLAGRLAEEFDLRQDT